MFTLCYCKHVRVYFLSSINTLYGSYYCVCIHMGNQMTLNKEFDMALESSFQWLIHKTLDCPNKIYWKEVMNYQSFFLVELGNFETPILKTSIKSHWDVTPTWQATQYNISDNNAHFMDFTPCESYKSMWGHGICLASDSLTIEAFVWLWKLRWPRVQHEKSTCPSLILKLSLVLFVHKELRNAPWVFAFNCDS
jgi:hypothetical protein